MTFGRQAPYNCFKASSMAGRQKINKKIETP